MSINSKGIVHLLPLLIAALGILLFIFVTSTTDFKNSLFSTLYPKPASQAASDINVDFTNTIRTLHPLAISMDESAYGRNGIYITDDVIHRERIKELKIAGMRMSLKYSIPGEPGSPIRCSATGCNQTVTGDQWVSAIKQTGAQVTIELHQDKTHTLSTATADAANMVRHFNINTSNPVKRWIIGNEPDNSGSSSNMSATDYSNRFNALYDAMKAVDPTIEIGGPATAYYNTGFLDTFLTISGGRADFVDFHTYGQGGTTVRAQDVLLSETDRYENYINDLKGRIQTKQPSRASEIEIEVGEWNLDWDGEGVSQSEYKQYNTVWSASALGHILKAGGISMQYASKNGDLGALWEYQTANSPTGWQIDDRMPIFHGIGMYTGESISGFPRFGNTMVNSSTILPNVEVYVSNNPKNIVVINKDPSASHDAEFSLTGVTSGTVDVFRKDQNVEPKDLPVKQSSTTINSGTFSYTIPPYSVTAFIVNESVTPTPTPAPTPTPTPTPLPTPSGNGLSGTYFDNKDLSGTTVTRIDPTVNFNWGLGSPIVGIGNETFSVRWAGKLVPASSDTYTFYVKSDDGARLWVDNVQILNNWVDQGATEKASIPITLTGGEQYDVKLEYYDNIFDAVVELRYSSPSVTKQIIPQSQLFSVKILPTPTPTPLGSGLKGDYFDNKDFTIIKVTRIDPTVNFNWGSGIPIVGVAPDTFSIRWTGFITPSSTGSYSFYVKSDDGARLWINNKQIINNWKDQGALEKASKPITLIGGQRSPIKLEFYDNTNDAVIELRYSSSSITKQIIPQSQLSPQ